MTNWRTDKPIAAIPPVRRLDAPAEIAIARTERGGRTSLGIARAFYLNRLRKWAKGRKDGKPPSDDP